MKIINSKLHDDQTVATAWTDDDPVVLMAIIRTLGIGGSVVIESRRYDGDLSVCDPPTIGNGNSVACEFVPAGDEILREKVSLRLCVAVERGVLTLIPSGDDTRLKLIRIHAAACRAVGA